MAPSTILIENGTVLTVNEHSDVLSPGYVWIMGDTIAAVGQGVAPDDARRQAGRVLDAKRMAVMPGMVNSHVHLFQSFVRGIGGDRPLLAWLSEIVWPVFANMTPHDIYLASLVSLAENIRGGATAVIDNQYVHTHPDDDDAACRAAEVSGARYLLARGWADRNYYPALQETPERILGEARRLHQDWHGRANGRIRVQSGPLIPWGCSQDTLVQSLELARTWGVGIHMHVAETEAEVQMSIESTGLRPVEWLHAIGLLGPHMQLVHSVWLSDREIELICDTGSVVVHCPVSNMYLASGIAPIARLSHMGAAVALATDGQACNNGEEMIGILKATSNLQKVGTRDAMALVPETILAMACRGGAMALGQPALLGSLETGKKADVVMVDLDNLRTMVSARAPSALVNEAEKGDVSTVIVDGQILMHEKRLTTIDEVALLEEAREAYAALLRRANVLT